MKETFEHKGLVVTRDDLESYLCPFYTSNVSDETMQTITEQTYNAMVNYNAFNQELFEMYCKDPERLRDTNYDLYESIDKSFYEELENSAVANGVKYYDEID